MKGKIVENKQMEEIRADLDHVFPDGGYRLEYRKGQPLRVVVDKRVHRAVREFAEEVVRLHGVEFKTHIS